LVRIRAAGGNRGPGAVHQTPGRFARVVVEQDGQAEGQALGEAGAVVEDGVRIVVAGRRIGAAAAAAVIATADTALVKGEAGAIINDGGRVEVAGRAVGAAPAGAVVPGADSAQVEVGTAAIVHRGVGVVVAARRVGAAVDDPADADVVDGDVGHVRHAGTGGIAVDELDAPFTIPGEACATEVDRGRVKAGVARGPVGGPQDIVAEVGAAGRDGGGEPAELDALPGRGGDDHEHVGRPASRARRVVERDVEGADLTGSGEGRGGAGRTAAKGLGDAQVSEAVTDAPDRWVGARPVVDRGVRIVVAGGAVGAAHAA